MTGPADSNRPGITARRFASNADADRHDAEFWRRIPPHERVLLAWRLSLEQWQLLGRARDESGLCFGIAAPSGDRITRLEQEAERARMLAAAVDGWLSDAQGRALLHAAAATTGRGAIVEIGSWKGRSTTWIAVGAKFAGRRVYAIDPHRRSREDPAADTLAEFLDNIRRAGVADVVDPLVMTSEEAAAEVKEPVELLFIDGDHSCEGARRDAELWLPRLVDGGTVMCHDVATAGYTGPRRVFQQMVCRDSRYDQIRRVGSMLVARRTERRSRGAALWGLTAGVLLYVYDVKRVLRRLRRWPRLSR